MSESVGESRPPGRVWYSPLSAIGGQELDAKIHAITPEHRQSWREFLPNRRKRVLILGVGSVAEELQRTLRQNRDHPYDIMGYADGSSDPTKETQHGPRCLGTYEELLSIVEKHGISTIAVCIQNQRGMLPMNALLDLKSRGVEIVEGPLLEERVQERLLLAPLKPSHLIFTSTTFRTQMFRVWKRVFDVTGAFSALVLLAPLLIALAFLIMIVSQRPPLARTPRVGRYGRRFFQCYFRITDGVGDSKKTVQNSVRRWFLHGIGRFMTRCHFDMLPQLINILCGDMSFVGPRPEHVQSAHERDKVIPFYSMRHRVRPGMTGWAQVQPKGLHTSSCPEYELQYDLYYVRQQYFLLDIRILLRTIGFSLLKVRE